MTLLCVPITVEPGDGGIARAGRDTHAAHRAGADLVELRIDAFAEHAEDIGLTAAQVSPLAADSPLPVIVTCRSAAEGGLWTGADADLASLLRALADSPAPAYVDVELASLERSPALAALARDLAQRAHDGGASPRVIASLHDFTGRPADLTRRLVRLRERDDAAIHKVVWRARSLRDNLELFEILATRDRPTIALGMGEFGLLSRVLAPKFGGFLTFASLGDDAATAPGQPTIADLLGLYRFRSIGPATRVFGVVGWPVGHSRSPAVHNAAFDAAGFDGVYLPMPTPPEWEHFTATVGALIDDPRLGFAGASVTIPHKEHLVRLARERADEGWSLDALSDASGAGNTLVRDTVGWRGMNTDGPAIVACLRDAGFEPRGGSVAILGAGGVARASAGALAAEGAAVTIHNRAPDRAEAVAHDLAPLARAHGGSVLAAPMSDAERSGAGAVINATPIGMTGGPAPGRAPIDLRAITDAGRAPIVLDTVYAPRDTPLLREARALGLPTVDGLALFLRQAAGQSAAFIGGPAPTDAMARALAVPPGRPSPND